MQTACCPIRISIHSPENPSHGHDDLTYAAHAPFGKAVLSIEKQGRRSVYTPLVSREEYQAAQSKTFVEKLFGGSMSAFAAALCQSGLSREELEELRQLLERDAL